MGTSRRSKRLSADVLSVLRESVQDKIFPGDIPFGHQTYDPSARPITQDFIFDAASLTKVVATTTAVMQLVEGKQLYCTTWLASFFRNYSGHPRTE
jgi:hypothetical protein